MYPRTEKRDNIRIKREIPIIVENRDSGSLYRGVIFNYSRCGLYFESDHVIRPGTKIYLRSNYLRTAITGFFQAEVRWSEEIDDPVVLFLYGTGVRFFSPSDYKQFIRRGLRVIPGGKKGK